MAPPERPLIAANWKMNGLRWDGAALAGAVRAYADADGPPAADIVLCPPATLLIPLAARLEGSPVRLGAQDCHADPSGAFTGDLSAPMLRDAGCAFVIVGHSERRSTHHETDEMVRAKATAVLAAGMIPIICVGETEAERESGHALETVTRQVRHSSPSGGSAVAMVIAYEPIWAIGTGNSASIADIVEMHGAIRDAATSCIPDGVRLRVLYGGSVKPANAAEVLSCDGVNGALVGGASLDAAAFWSIVEAADDAIG